MSETDNSANRDRIINNLREEMIGPAPAGEDLDCTAEIVFADAATAYRAYRQMANGDEILQRDGPLNRYGAATLHPLEKKKEKDAPIIDKHSTGRIVFEDVEDESNYNDSVNSDEPDPDFLNLATANQELPSSMAISFLAEVSEDSQLTVNVRGGRYNKLPVKIQKVSKVWWARREVQIAAAFSGADILKTKGKTTAVSSRSKNTEGLDLSVELFSRPNGLSDQYLVTAVLINRTALSKGFSPDECALFQSEFDVSVTSPNGKHYILPYPQSVGRTLTDEEESIALLYRRAQTFAVGHGCSADWDREVGESEKVQRVNATHFPVFEAPAITSEIKRADRSTLEIPMAKLAGLIPGDDGSRELEDLLDEYERWIGSQETEAAALEPRYRPAANRNLAQCRQVLTRMRDGVRFLETNEKARLAFRFANCAMLIQQYRSKQPLRESIIKKAGEKPAFSNKLVNPDLLTPRRNLGQWRGFQIGLLLMAVRSAVDPDCTERELVELIWFATGGGKTEAYLALAAFSLFFRLLNDPTDSGTHIIMRYTLRLLTGQQFERASALICAMESIRRKNVFLLGEKEISIGLWVGNEVTPGTRKEAVKVLRNLKKNPQWTANKFILSRCPWCAAQMGKIEPAAKRDHRRRRQQQQPVAGQILGYEEKGGTVDFVCPDEDCEFAAHLPVYVTDEDIYRQTPSMVIATVDKIAILPWKPEARSLFGFDKNGDRVSSPPGFINQDELHLIAGPIGSMFGLFEALIEELCTDRRGCVGGGGMPKLPKIICSTATTRCYQEQVKAVFGREQTQLFPPPGITVGNSFFSSYALDQQGIRLPGRKYVGINAPGLGSIQNTQVRVFTALLQTSLEFSPSVRDAYWTLFVFYNNLKILGDAISLFQSNVPAYFMTYKSRTRQPKIRYIRQPLELTGRLQSDEVPAALRRLETKWTEKQIPPAVDTCVASSIAEVGMDVGRLGLMSVIGQPKTIAQYIQITGRVGRDKNSPGLIVIIYSANKVRDRSHFERFRSFHERLYAQVEPLSLTPFSLPALLRGLHAIIAAYIRQTGSPRQAALPFPFPQTEIDAFKEILVARVKRVAPEMLSAFEAVFKRRINEWRRWEKTQWTGNFATGEHADALLRPFDSRGDESSETMSWPTPFSMRNVDAQAELDVTHFYQTEIDLTVDSEAEGE